MTYYKNSAERAKAWRLEFGEEETFLAYNPYQTMALRMMFLFDMHPLALDETSDTRLDHPVFNRKLRDICPVQVLHSIDALRPYCSSGAAHALPEREFKAHQISLVAICNLLMYYNFPADFERFKIKDPDELYKFRPRDWDGGLDILNQWSSFASDQRVWSINASMTDCQRIRVGHF